MVARILGEDLHVLLPRDGGCYNVIENALLRGVDSTAIVAAMLGAWRIWIVNLHRQVENCCCRAEITPSFLDGMKDVLTPLHSTA